MVLNKIANATSTDTRKALVSIERSTLMRIFAIPECRLQLKWHSKAWGKHLSYRNITCMQSNSHIKNSIRVVTTSEEIAGYTRK